MKKINLLLFILCAVPLLQAIEDKSGNLISFAAKGQIYNLGTLLPTQKAHLNEHNENGRTALMEAADNGNTLLVTMLIGAGADKSLKDNNGKTAAQLFAERFKDMSPAQKEIHSLLSN